VIREMTRLCNRHNAVNLAQGFPDFPAPAEMKRAAQEAIAAREKSVRDHVGREAFRDALVEKTKRFTGLTIDPERELTVCCGSTEAMISAMLATVDPGEEMIVFEPFYENYGPDAILSGAKTSLRQTLARPTGRSIARSCAARFSPRTKGIIVNTPHNPTGKVYTREELTFIGELAIEHDALIYTDEIYEHILYDGREHVTRWRCRAARTDGGDLRHK